MQLNNKSKNIIMLLISIIIYILLRKIIINICNKDFCIIISLITSILVYITFIGLINNRVNKFNRIWYHLMSLLTLGQSIDDLDYKIALQRIDEQKDVRNIENIYNSKTIYLIIHLGLFFLIDGVLLFIQYKINKSNYMAIPIVLIILSFILMILIPTVTSFIYTKVNIKNSSKSEKIASLLMIIILIFNLILIFVYKVNTDIMTLSGMISLIIIVLILSKK